MKDYLLKHGRYAIKCEIEGLQMTYTLSDDSEHHTVVTLRDTTAFDELKEEINNIYNSFENRKEGYCMVCEYLETTDCHYKYFIGEPYYYCDLRDRNEIEDFLDEAYDKVWLMRNCDISRRKPRYEVERASIERILEDYDDIPKDGYSDWECGYWNGIIGALRWMLGDDKHFLDT